MKTPLNTINDLLLCIKKIDRTRDQSLISLIAATGLYLDEIRHISSQDINDDLTIIHTTGKRPRKLSISSFAKPYLNQWLLERPNSKHKALFISLTGDKTPLSQRGVDNIIRKWSDTTNLNFNYQKLRTLSHLSGKPPLSSPKPSPHSSQTSSDHSQTESISITHLVPIVSLCLALIYKTYKIVVK